MRFVQKYKLIFNLDIFRSMLHIFVQQNGAESLYMKGVQKGKRKTWKKKNKVFKLMLTLSHEVY